MPDCDKIAPPIADSTVAEQDSDDLNGLESLKNASAGTSVGPTDGLMNGELTDNVDDVVGSSPSLHPESIAEEKNFEMELHQGGVLSSNI